MSRTSSRCHLFLLTLLAFILVSAFSQPAAAQDGVFETPFPGGSSFDGGKTTEEASASDKAVPATDGKNPQNYGDYYRKVVDWFVAWLDANNVDTSAVEIVILEQEGKEAWSRPHMKLRASRDLKSGEVIFRLPASVQLSSAHILKGYNPYSNPDTESGWSGYTAIASWLLKEVAADTKSPWAPYLRLLPQTLNIPIFYPQALVQELQFDSTIETLKAYMDAIEMEYAACTPQALNNKTKDDFAWGVAIGMTRAFDGMADPELDKLSGKSHGKATVLLPLADMMDHSNEYNAESEIDAEGAFVWRVNRDLAKGDELLNQYGLKNTDHLLLSYGFILDPNEHDSVRVLDRRNASRDMYRAYYVKDAASFTDAEDNWALYTGAQGNDAADKVAGAEREASSGLHGPKYDPPYADELHVWEGGIIDPHILSALAATVYYFSFREEPNYDNLARISVWYGWELYSGSCFELAQSVPLTGKETQAFVAAAAGVKTLVDAFLKSLPTTIEEDENIVGAMAACMEGGDSVESNPELKHYCDSLAAGGIPLADHQLVVRSRLLKKRVLRDVSERLASTCHPSQTHQSPDAPGNDEYSSGDALEDGEGGGVPAHGSATGEKVVQDGTSSGEPEIRISTSENDDPGAEGKGKSEVKQEGKKTSRGWWSE